MFYAKEAHRSVNHKYDDKPYEIHLQMVSDVGLRFIHLIPERDIENVFAAIWLHDTIEDCRKTYNDIKKQFGCHVADIVYACTNEKGKTRGERANDKYYKGIRETEYAVFVKVCDRIANMEYSIQTKSRMAQMYADELPEFKGKLFVDEKLGDMFMYLEHLASNL